MSRTSPSQRERRSPLTALEHVRARRLTVGLKAGLKAGLVVALLVAPGSALALEPDKSVNQFPHRIWTADDGLPQNTTQALAQTPDGYLWAGTYEGLARFDGAHFTVFDSVNTPALKDRSITALAVDREGTLWISSTRGLAGMQDGRFFSIPLPESVVAREVFKLLPARDGSLWLATLGSGLARMSQRQFQVWKTGQGLASDRVQALAEDGAGRLWVATSEGLQRWDGSAFIPGPSFPGQQPQVTALAAEASGVLWAGDQQGNVYKSQEGVMLPVPEAGMPGDPITVLLIDRQGALWVASRGKGLVRVMNGQRSMLEPAKGLDHEAIFSMLEDAEGSLWLGMGANGLHRLKDAPITPYGVPEGLAHDVVSAVREARDGSLWFTTLGGGISRWKDGRMTTWTMHDGLVNDRVFGSAEGRDGSLWFVTRKGVIRWHEGTFTQLPAPGQALPFPLGQAIYEDEHGTLWVGTDEGLSRWNGEQFAMVSRQDKVLGANIKVLERRAAGGFWIGTQGGGLAWYENGRFSVLASPGAPMDGDVRGIHEEGGTLWVGTMDGLFRWKDGHAVRLSRAQGLFDDVVFAIIPDGRGSVWMTCNRGIFRVSQQELEAVADGRRKYLTSYVYGKEDGMRAEECNALGGPAGILARDGKLWFPTIRGAVAYEPEREKAPAALPPMRIEALRVDDRPLAASEWSRIPPGGGRVEIHYTTPALASAGRVRFRYRIDDFDADWVDAGIRRIAYYTGLPPGEHWFLVEASSTEGNVPVSRAALRFYLRPRAFETIYFRVGLALFLVFAAAGLVWFRLWRARQRELQLQARVDERTAELALRVQQLEATQERLAHAEKLVAVGTLAAGVGHEINNPLAYILSNLRYLSRELRALKKREGSDERWHEVGEALTDALHGAERVRKIVHALKTLARVQVAPASQVDLHTVIDRAVEMKQEDVSRRARLVKDYGAPQRVMGDEAHLGQVFFHLLENAAQAISEGEPERNEVRITTRGDSEGRVVVELRDTGHGIPPEILPRIFEPFFTTKEAGEGPGLGLSICHATIQAMGGEIHVESQPGQGTTFRILLPAMQEPPAQVLAAAAGQKG